METRRFRIDFDLGARLTRLDRDRAHGEVAVWRLPSASGTGRALEPRDRQERLLEAIAANDDVVDRLLRGWAGFAIDYTHEVWPDQGREIVLSLVPSLDPEDRAFFDPEAVDGILVFDALWLGLAVATPATIASVAVLPGTTAVPPESAFAERMYRAVVLVDLELDEIRPAAIRKLFTNDFQPGELPPGVSPAEYARRQRALREALLRDDDALDAWFRNAAVLKVTWSFEDSMLPPPARGAELIESVLPALAPHDREFYRDAIDGEYVWDVAGEVLLSAESRIRRVWVREVE